MILNTRNISYGHSGFCGKAFFKLAPALLRSRGNLPQVIAKFVETELKGGGGPVGFGMFLGCFLSVFESIMRFTAPWLRASPKKGLTSAQRSILAGGIAGFAIKFLPSDAQIGVSFFFFVRALEVLLKRFHEDGLMPYLPNWEVIVTGLASAENLYCWIFEKSALESSYKRFLDVHGGKSEAQYLAVANLNDGYSEKLSAEVYAMIVNDRRRRGITAPLVNSEQNADLYCQTQHPDSEYCTLAHLRFLRQGVRRAIPVYMPVYVIPLLLFKRGRLLRQPLQTTLYVAMQIVQSSLFLGSYCTLAWAGVCLTRRLTGLRTPAIARLAGIFSGFSQLIERPPRRIELTLYILAQAFESAWNRLGPKFVHGRNWSRATEHMAVLVFVASMAGIMNTYINKPYLMRPSYFSLFRFFFGSGGIEAGFPREHSFGSRIDLAKEDRIEEDDEEEEDEEDEEVQDAEDGHRHAELEREAGRKGRAERSRNPDSPDS
eukprot:g59565.t1